MQEQILASSTRSHHERGLDLFREFLGRNTMMAEELIEWKKKERTFETRIIMFFKWLQSEKSLSENTARSYIIGLQSLFTYAGVPLRLKNKLPKLHMKIETYRPTVEDLQKLYSYGDLEIKAWLSLSRDCPARISDLLRISFEQSQQEEFMLLSEKENIIGKVYLSSETHELFKRCKEANVELPRTQKGIDKLLERACKLAGIPHKINQHLLRKVWISSAINLGLNEIVIKILSFKAVPQDILTYFLERSDLKESWLKVVNALPLKPQGNGRITNLQENVELIGKVLAKLILKELQQGINFSRSIILTEDLESYREILEAYLKETRRS
jgi:hypothetical protein